MTNVRHSFSVVKLVEVVALFALVAMLVGLFVVGVQKSRESAKRTTCLNNLRQIGLAVHTCNDTYKKLPPVNGLFPGTHATDGTAFGGPLFHLAPFVESSDLYSSTSGKTVTTSPGTYLYGNHTIYFPGNNNVFSREVPTYVCPVDPGVQGNGTVTLTLPAAPGAAAGVATVWGAASYGINGFAFTKEPGYHQNVDPPTSNGAACRLNETNCIAKDIPDGLANTIMVAHRYAQCQSAAFPSGGSAWGYASDPSFAPPFHGAEIGIPLYAMHAAVAVPVFGTGALGSASMFQAQPFPYAGTNSVCNPLLAQTPHGDVMPICLFDASVRTISIRVSPATYWHYMTPAGREPLDPDIDN